MYPHLAGFYPTTMDYLKNVYKDQDQINQVYQEYRMEPTSFKKIPKSIENKMHWKFAYTANSTPPSAFVVRLDKGRIASYNGAIISPDNHLIFDLSIEFWANKPEEHYLLHDGYFPTLQLSNENVAALTFCASQYYYHWFFDVLPRFYLLTSMGIEADRYAINWNGRPGFQDETLDLLGIDKRRIMTVTENTNLQAKSLFVPSLPGYTGHMGKWTVDFLRNELMEKALEKSANIETPKRFYISRENAFTRKVVNDHDLVPFLQSHGFAIVHLENMSVVDQIRLFSNAEIIIGAHGGGLSNLAFCKPETKVVEIFSPNYVHTCYWVLSGHVEADYHYLLGTGPRPPELVDPNCVHENIRVDMKEMQKLLELLL